MTTPPPTDKPQVSKPGLSGGFMLASIGTILTIAVGGTQLVLNGMEIRKSVAPPVTTHPVEHGDLTPGTGRAPRGESDATSSGDAPKLSALDQSVGMLGGDAASSPSLTPAVGRWLDYPLTSGKTLPPPIAQPIHRLFVALEQGIRNAGDYTYVVYLPDTDAVRQMKKPPKEGTAIPLPDGATGVALSVRLTQDLWERIQHAEGQQLVLIGCVCVQPECASPTLEWEMVRKALDDKTVQTTSIEWGHVGRGEPGQVVRESGVPCTIPGPLILALVTPEGV